MSSQWCPLPIAWWCPIPKKDAWCLVGMPSMHWRLLSDAHLCPLPGGARCCLQLPPDTLWCLGTHKFLKFHSCNEGLIPLVRLGMITGRRLLSAKNSQISQLVLARLMGLGMLLTTDIRNGC